MDDGILQVTSTVSSYIGNIPKCWNYLPLNDSLRFWNQDDHNILWGCRLAKDPKTHDEAMILTLPDYERYGEEVDTEKSKKIFMKYVNETILKEISWEDQGILPSKSQCAKELIISCPIQVHTTIFIILSVSLIGGVIVLVTFLVDSFKPDNQVLVIY